MRRRHVIVGLVVLALAASPWLVALAIADRPTIFQRANRLQKELTEAEVISAMGRSPDHIQEDVKYREYYFSPDGTRLEPDRVRALGWSAGERTVWIIIWEGKAIDRWRTDGPIRERLFDHLGR